jgi:POT family proton-dependent oligopeptide transporter
MKEIAHHPRGLYTLFFTEMWERFSYYGMRALLVLYLTSELIHGGFQFTREHALEIYGIFTALVYLTPLLGGFIADKILGQRKSIYIGGILMAMGQAMLAISHTGNIENRTFWLVWGLGLLVMGNGFFKPNISAIVGRLYNDTDPRKDSAFTLFYMGINIGAFFSPIVAGTLGENIGWQYGFASASVGMIIGMIWFYSQGKYIESAGLPPHRTYDPSKKHQLNGKDRLDIFIWIVSVMVLVIGCIKLWSVISDTLKNGTLITLGIIGAIGLITVIATNTKGKDEWTRVFVILVLCFFNVFFFAGFEQAGGTMNLFAEENTNRQLLGWNIPASMFQAVNPVFIILLAPVFSFIWTWLMARGKEPRTPVKFGLSLVFLGLGFMLMQMATIQSANNLVNPMWLVGVYLLHTIGELCLSPIGLSMISKLSPQRIVSVMMGVWFACISLAQYLAGVLEAILKNYLPSMPLFSFLTLTSLCAGAVLLLISPILNKMMKGVH